MRKGRGAQKNAGWRKEVKKGAVVRLEVTGIAPGGAGVAQDGKRRYYVRGGLPGDRVDARVVKQEGGRIEARVERLLESRVERIEPRCRHFGICGGCLWQDISYADQLALKKGIVLHCFQEAGLDGGTVADVMGSEEVFFYRNKMDFSFGQHRAGDLMLGLFASARTAGGERARLSERRGRMPPVFDVEACCLQSEASNRMVKMVRDILKGSGLRAYNPETGSGVLRSLVIREGTHTGEALVTLGVSGSAPDGGVAEALTEAFENVKGVVLSVNPKRSKHAVSASQEALAGSGQIVERILGLEVEVSPGSFLQVNTRQAERLYERAVGFAGLEGEEAVLDLYCGNGTLSLLLARHARRVTGVEVLEQAVEDARRNAGRNRMANCRFVCGDVLRVLPELAEDRVDVVTVNPPRAGVYRAVVQTICAMRPRRVVYISCNPETLARDLVAFQAGGYRPDRVQPVDLFPHTPHCEVVVGMARNDG